MVRRTSANPVGFVQFLALSDDVGGLGGAHPGGIAIAFADAVRMLKDLGVEHAVFGAFAVAAYVSERRSTLDIDLVANSQSEARVSAAAPNYGFREQARERESEIRTFIHRTGVRLDVIFDARGAFVDFRTVRRLELPGVGEVSVADVFDIAWAKFRTQDRSWPRDPAKRATDYADLVALLRSDETLARRLYDRIWARSESTRNRRLGAENETLERLCRDADIAFPGAPKYIPFWVGAAVLLALLVIGYIVSCFV